VQQHSAQLFSSERKSSKHTGSGASSGRLAAAGSANTTGAACYSKRSRLKAKSINWRSGQSHQKERKAFVSHCSASDC